LNKTEPNISIDRHHSTRVPIRLFYRRFLFLSSLIIFIFLIAGSIAYRIQAQFDKKEELIQNQGAVELVAKFAEHDFDTIIADLLFLAIDDTVSNFLQRENNTNPIEQIEHVKNQFINLASTRRLYDQIRLLDPSGHEVIRVNYENGSAKALSPGQLQNKSNRYYFSSSAKLAMGEVYISPTDLNIENGKIEIPHKPMIRFGTPLYDTSGEFRGVIILNYLAKVLIDQFKKQMELAPGTGFLVNGGGYFLSSPVAADEWAFMLGGNANFNQKFPEAWQSIKEFDAGIIDTSEGRFTYSTTHPYTHAPNASEESRQRRDWKIITASYPRTGNFSLIFSDMLKFYPLALLLPVCILIAWYFSRESVGKLMAEKKLVLTNLSLEKEVDNRTANLKAAMEEAKQANQHKSDFLASMSHELRTPLNAVLGFAQMLQLNPKTPLTPSQSVHVNCIVEGGEHLLELVNDILDLAKIEADQVSLTLTDINIVEAVSDCVKLISPLGEPRGLTMTNKLITQRLPMVRSDLTRFRQALLNLLSNAVKFNKDGGSVTIDAHETDDHFLRILVTDTGTGIAKESYPDVFQIFNRLDIDPLVSKEGTGIGLPVTKMLVERMSGRVGFESKKGIGSTFWIELPLTSNQDILIWDDDLRIGIKAIDKDHQILISLMNSIFYYTSNLNDLTQTIGELIDFTRYHFTREEAIMEVCNFPEIEKYRHQNQSLSTQVSKLEDNWREQQNPKILDTLRKLLSDWLVDHIQNSNANVAQYSNGKEKDILRALECLEQAKWVSPISKYSTSTRT
jgi:hemerythrin-like metal-binding protein